MRLLALLLLTALVVVALDGFFGRTPAVGALLDPLDGVYRTARLAVGPREATLAVPGLQAPVTVLRDERGVPHVFAAHDLDAVAALGFVVAQDRTFQLDFIPRAASGDLAAVFGPSLIETDRYLRATGMRWGAEQNWARIQQENGEEKALLEAFTRGVNAYFDGLAPAAYPFEMRLLGYGPDRWTPLHSLLVLQYMHFDLSWPSDEAAYGPLRAELGAEFDDLYPAPAAVWVPIVPGSGALRPADLRPGLVPRFAVPDTTLRRDARPDTAASAPRDTVLQQANRATVRAQIAAALRAGAVPGLTVGERQPGKGSNNWAVFGSRSATGQPVLANDMHLGLTLPAIWYEAHLVTPSMNTYGVTIPGAPLPVAAFNDHVAWGFTNTDADQVDHYRLTLDPSGRRYRYLDKWLDIQAVVDTLWVKRQGFDRGAPFVLDTLFLTHWGPMVERTPTPIALQWTAHKPQRTLGALFDMNRATSFEAFQQALRRWDGPMQNILVAAGDGRVAIRATAQLPIRRGGETKGLLDGATDDGEWIGWIPFEELPYSENPPQGYLFSANQPPVGPSYPYYLNRDWWGSHRALRLEALFEQKPAHTAADLRRYQGDVKVMQHELLLPLLQSLTGLDEKAERTRQQLLAWDGYATLSRREPVAFEAFYSTLRMLTWDELQGEGRITPHNLTLYRLLVTDPGSRWFDRQATLARETGPDLLRHALAAAHDTLRARYGGTPPTWREARPGVLYRHLTQAAPLAALGRGPFPYPGFSDTVSPGGGQRVTFSASWRVVVDFRDGSPVAQGIYPGGQSGNPFSPHYDAHIPVYQGFAYYPLHRPKLPDLVAAPVQRLVLEPLNDG